MKRRLFNLLTVLSLLLCVAVGVLWVRSYWVRDTLTWGRDGIVTSVQLDTHRVCSATSVVCAYGGIHVERTQVRTGQFAFGWPPSGFSHTHSDDIDGYPALDAPPVLETNIGSMFMWTWGRFQLVSADDSAGQADPIYRSSHRSATFPLWLPALVCGAATAGTYRRVRRFRTPGLCPRCGYDVRATPSRCPECGREGQTVDPTLDRRSTFLPARMTRRTRFLGWSLVVVLVLAALWEPDVRAALFLLTFWLVYALVLGSPFIVACLLVWYLVRRADRGASQRGFDIDPSAPRDTADHAADGGTA